MRRKLINISVFLASFILGICLQIVWLSWTVSGPYDPEPLPGTVSQDYDLGGYYYPAPEFPLAFDNVSRFDLTTADFHVNLDSSVTKTPIPPTGYLVTDYDVHKFSDVKIDGAQLSFTTEQRFGVSYQFTGRATSGDYPVKGYSQYY